MQTNLVYIGSTVQSLEERFRCHKKDFKNYTNGTYHYVSSYEIIKHDDAYIELIEDFPCASRRELFAREGAILRGFPVLAVVNKRIETGLPRSEAVKQQRQDPRYKERIKEYKERPEVIIRVRETDNARYHRDHDKRLKASNDRYALKSEEINARRSVQIECECGSYVQRVYTAGHKKTFKHWFNLLPFSKHQL